MNDKRHQIHEIADKGGNPVNSWVTDNINKHTASIIISLHEIADTKTEALDALLAKLRSIVCPDYADLRVYAEECHAEHESIKDSLQAELSALKQSLEYNRGEVNRLNNVIANKDWEIDELKKSVSQEKHRADFNLSQFNKLNEDYQKLLESVYEKEKGNE